MSNKGDNVFTSLLFIEGVNSSFKKRIFSNNKASDGFSDLILFIAFLSIIELMKFTFVYLFNNFECCFKLMKSEELGRPWWARMTIFAFFLFNSLIVFECSIILSFNNGFLLITSEFKSTLKRTLLFLKLKSSIVFMLFYQTILSHPFL